MSRTKTLTNSLASGKMEARGAVKGGSSLAVALIKLFSSALVQLRQNLQIQFGARAFRIMHTF